MKRKRSTRSSVRYPAATLAAYGPDNTCATKLVVSVLERPGQRDPFEMRAWTTQEGDVRNDSAIAAEVADFMLEHGIKESASGDRIIGCPHEEGIDYPDGSTCPQCPFWANRDRYEEALD